MRENEDMNMIFAVVMGLAVLGVGMLFYRSSDAQGRQNVNKITENAMMSDESATGKTRD